MLFDAGSDVYTRATQPHTSSVTQRPARVAVVDQPDRLPEVLEEVAALARARGRALTVVPQATGHGAGAIVDDDVVLLDTSGLRSVEVDVETRVARVGAGATWSDVNAVAQQHGLLGLAGSAPSVSVSGYTFGGGVGWLVRRDGLASGSLRAVGYVDGHGRLRRAADDAPDPVDRDAIWAFRGAGGVGVAHTLELDLVPAPDLHAGALLWSADALPAVLEAWSRTVPGLGPGVSSSVSVLHVPPLPTFPEALRGSVAVHLAVAAPDGPDAATPLLEAVRAATTPVADGWGRTDAAGLARIHLDPPTATPAIGDARWLDATTPALAADLLSTAAAADSPIVMLELRHLAGAPTRRAGAVVTPPGAFIFHAVGALGRSPRPEIDAGFARARSVWEAADTGLTPGSWVEGAGSVPDALPVDVRERARAVADAVDPERRLARSRLLG
ncbi:FAD-binding oxidoreductase [Microlunatus spumicola]|uniref:FAD-binding oxidoreductase n=1 Tax=Microlunatus spumicola TaxID=81499 RepID=A0ABP6X924_9ACTN